MENSHITNEFWYAYRVFHGKMKFVKEQLSKDGLQFFIPVRIKQEMINKNIIYHEEPIIPSLLFIRSTEIYMKELKAKYTTHLSVYTNPCTKKAAIIADDEMEIFREVLTKGCERLDVIDEKLIKGNHVRITGGIFEGAEGYITRVHGTKRFVVIVKGIAAVATIFIPRCFIEKIEK